MDKYSINPLFVAPPIFVAAIALLAYVHFKGKERTKAWDDGCSIDMQKSYDTCANIPVGTTQPIDASFLADKRFIKTSDGKILIIDLTEIQRRSNFEGAKREYNLSTYLLPLLALILIVALVGTRLFLWKCPLPRPI